MRNRFLKHGIWIACVAALAACNRPLVEDPDIIVTLQPEFTVDLFEERDPLDGTPVFGLWIESMDTFDCGNYRIEALRHAGPDSISVTLEEIGPPDTCIGAPAPARGFIPIGPLADGAYAFSFRLNEALVSKATLLVQSGHYELTAVEQRGVDFQQRVLESIGGEMLWGFASARDENEATRADDFLAELKTISVESGLAPGYYGYFTVSGTGQFFLHRRFEPAYGHRPFLRRLTGTQEALRSLTQSFRADPVQPLGVQCWSVFGEF